MASPAVESSASSEQGGSQPARPLQTRLAGPSERRQSGARSGRQSGSASAAESSRPKVSSACDSCKRRKVKCTGTQPCDKCIATGVACTFGSWAGRTSAVSYTKYLEDRVAELQALLRQQPSAEIGTILPLAPGLPLLTHREGEDAQYVQSQETARDNILDTMIGPGDDFVYTTPSNQRGMYHGHYSGLSVLRQVRAMCSTVGGGARQYDAGRELAEAFDSNALSEQSHRPLSRFALLPSMRRLEQLVNIALRDSLTCSYFIERDELDRQIQRLYDTDPEDYTRDDQKALALLYALIALGRRYEPYETSIELVNVSTDMHVMKGIVYFSASKDILDMTDCNDLGSIRTMHCLALFLISESMLSQAYSLNSAGIAACLRMGLHVSSQSQRNHFTDHELTQRRQVFAVLNMTDSYLASTLGMPTSVSEADPEQTIAVPQSELWDEGSSFVQQNPASPIAETILCTKLYRVQAKIVEMRFPANKHRVGHTRTFVEDYDVVAQREAELEEWFKSLPDMDTFPNPPPSQVLRSQLLLRLFHAALQYTLYRPFLHHVVRERRDSEFNYKGYVMGSACLRAAMQGVWLIESYDSHGFLHDAQWFLAYVLTQSATALTLFVLGTKEGPTIDESRATALRARGLLRKLATRSVSARKCYESLLALTESMPAEPMSAPRTLPQDFPTQLQPPPAAAAAGPSSAPPHPSDSESSSSGETDSDAMIE